LTLRAAKPAKLSISRHTPVLRLLFKIGDNSRTVGLNLRYGIFRLRIQTMNRAEPRIQKKLRLLGGRNSLVIGFCRNAER